MNDNYPSFRPAGQLELDEMHPSDRATVRKLVQAEIAQALEDRGQPMSAAAVREWNTETLEICPDWAAREAAKKAELFNRIDSVRIERGLIRVALAIHQARRSSDYSSKAERQIRLEALEQAFWMVHGQRRDDHPDPSVRQQRRPILEYWLDLAVQAHEKGLVSLDGYA